MKQAPQIKKIRNEGLTWLHSKRSLRYIAMRKVEEVKQMISTMKSHTNTPAHSWVELHLDFSRFLRHYTPILRGEKTAKREILRNESSECIVYSMKRHRAKAVNKLIRTFGGNGAYSCWYVSETWSVNRGSLWAIAGGCSIKAFRVCCSEDTAHDDWRKHESAVLCVTVIIFFSIAFSGIVACAVHTRQIKWKDGVKSRIEIRYPSQKKKEIKAPRTTAEGFPTYTWTFERERERERGEEQVK